MLEDLETLNGRSTLCCFLIRYFLNFLLKRTLEWDLEKKGFLQRLFCNVSKTVLEPQGTQRVELA